MADHNVFIRALPASESKPTPGLAGARGGTKIRVGSRAAPTRKAVDEAGATLSACLSLNGVVVAAGTKVRGRRVGGGSSLDEATLLTYVQNNPNSRGEQIAEALGTDTASVRQVMQRLIADRKVKTRGQRRGMTYVAV